MLQFKLPTAHPSAFQQARCRALHRSVVPGSRFSDCCGFGLTLLRPGRLPGGGHFRLLGRLRDRLRSGIWFRGRRGVGGLEDTPPSDVVVAHLALVHLLGRGPGSLSFRSGGVTCGGALSDALLRLLCKGRLRLFALNTAAVLRGVVTRVKPSQAKPNQAKILTWGPRLARSASRRPPAC